MGVRSDIDPEVHRRDAAEVVATLRRAGHEAFLVGGCVRDRLLGRVPREFDIATSARPPEVMALFKKTLAVGAQFGVVVVVTRHAQYDVATFRADAVYTDGRRPDGVAFVSAREDVLRRDFTINGLLEDPGTGELCDFVGGRDDLAARVIRTIGDPQDRFSEDHLRMLRAVRFAVTLGFDIEGGTALGILGMAPLVAKVSGERVRQELARIVSEGDPARGFTLLSVTGILATVLPEVDESRARTAAAVLQILGPCQLAVALAAMLGSEAPVPEVSERLKLTTDERSLLGWLLAAEGAFASVPEALAARIRFIRDPRWPTAAALHRARRLALGEPTATVDELMALRAELGPERLAPPRLLDGNDLKRLGLRPGPHYKRILDAVEDAQLEGRIATVEEAERLALLATSD